MKRQSSDSVVTNLFSKKSFQLRKKDKSSDSADEILFPSPELTLKGKHKMSG